MSEQYLAARRQQILDAAVAETLFVPTDPAHAYISSTLIAATAQR